MAPIGASAGWFWCFTISFFNFILEWFYDSDFLGFGFLWFTWAVPGSVCQRRLRFAFCGYGFGDDADWIDTDHDDDDDGDQLPQLGRAAARLRSWYPVSGGGGGWSTNGQRKLVYASAPNGAAPFSLGPTT